MRREHWLVLVTVFWVAGGLAALLQSEPPRGRVVGKVITAETGQPLAKVTVWFSHPQGDWRAVSSRDGVFELGNLPAGTYTVSASAYAHRLEPTRFTLREGETRQLLLPLEPVDPFLELIHPQTVFHPNEEVKVGVRGFVDTDELHLQVWQVRWTETLAGKVPLTKLLRSLEEVRQGWWRGPWELRSLLQDLAPCLTLIRRTSVPITQRDAEGVFLQFVPVDLPHDGVYLVQLRADGLERIALVERTRLGLVTKVGRSHNRKVTVVAYVADLVSGKPIKEVQVSGWVQKREQGRVRDQKLGTTASDENGLATFVLSPTQLAEVGSLFWVATLPEAPLFSAWVSLEEHELQEASQPEGLTAGAIYTDRPIYRPGNTVHIKGIVRTPSPNGYAVPAPQALTVVVRDPDGNVVHRTQTMLNNFGSFSETLRLNEEALTGTYTVTAMLREERGSPIEGSFVVAAYRKPEVQVTVKPTRSRFSLRDTATVEVSARYYFGMPIAGAKVKYWVSRVPIASETAGEEEWVDSGEGVLEGETRTNEKGRALIRFRPADLPQTEASFTEFRYIVSVTVEAAGYQFAEGQAQFLVTQGDWKVEVWCEPSFVRPEETVTAKVVVTHWDTKKPVPNASVQWRAGFMERRGKEERIRWRYRGQSQTSTQGEGQWQFAPVESGEWFVEALASDEKGNLIGATAMIWVTPQKGVSLALPQAPLLRLWLDKRTYRLGETAKVLLQSRVKDAAVLLTVEGERLYSAQVLSLQDGQAEWSLPLSPALIPNAYVSAVLVWRKRFVQQVEPMRFELAAYRLQVTVQSDRPLYEPREPARLTVRVQDEEGKPVKAELSLAVVDEAIYALREDDPEQVFRAFYSERPNRVVTRYSFPWLAWQGDKGEAETVRRYFPDTALWVPHLVTDDQGEAKVSLVVPDTLTQWRVTAIAHTLDTRIGFGLTRFRCAKPFGVRLSLPSVLTQGDQTTISAVVHNETEEPLTSDVHLRIDGISDTSGLVTEPLSQTVTVAPRRTASVRWTFFARKAGKLTVRVSAQSQKGHRDAEERPVTVLPHATDRIVARTVFFTPTVMTQQIAVVLPPNADLALSRIEVRLAPSVFSAILGALEYLATYPYGCVEQTMNSLLPDLLVWRVLKERGLKLPWLERELPQMVERGLTRLYRFQHDDGGWGWWEDDPTNLWMTALVVRGLAEAKQAGFPVSEPALQRGQRALRELLQQSWKDEKADDIAFGLFALARSGFPFPKELLAPFEQPRVLIASSQPFFVRPERTPPRRSPSVLDRLADHCSPYGLAFLALALSEWQRPEAQKVAEQLLRRATPLQEGLQWRWGKQGDLGWTQDEEVTAWGLLALMRTNSVDEETAVATVKALLMRRRGSGWVSTKDTAAILEALLDFARRYERVRSTAPSLVEVSLNGATQSVTLPPEISLQPETIVRLTGQLKTGVNEIQLTKPAGMSLWATVVSRQVLTLPERTGEVLGQQVVVRRYEKLTPKVQDGMLTWQARPLRDGDAVRVGELVRLTLTVKCPIDYMVLEDPLPAGFAPAGQLMQKWQEREAESDSIQMPKEFRDDRSVTYFRHSGTYTVSYLLRAEVPGEYHILPPKLWHMYGTERWLGAEARLSVRP